LYQHIQRDAGSGAVVQSLMVIGVVVVVLAAGGGGAIGAGAEVCWRMFFFSGQVSLKV